MQKDNAKKRKIFYIKFSWRQARVLDESSRVNPIPSQVESRRVENMLNSTWVKLKMLAIWLRIESNSKCQPETRLDDQSSYNAIKII